MNSVLLLSVVVACASSAFGAPPVCNMQGANSKKDRLAVEAFCNDPNAKTTGAALLKPLAGVWSWVYMPVLDKCHRHQLMFNGTDQVYMDTLKNVEAVYIEVDGVVFRDQPAKFHCGSVSANLYPLDSSPDHNVILQIDCVPAGYEFSLNIMDYAKVTQANRDEATNKYGFDLSNMDSACANLTAPSA